MDARRREGERENGARRREGEREWGQEGERERAAAAADELYSSLHKSYDQKATFGEGAMRSAARYDKLNRTTKLANRENAFHFSM